MKAETELSEGGTINLTALFEECEKKAGIVVKSFETGHRYWMHELSKGKGKVYKLTVEFSNTELTVFASFFDGFETLQKAVFDAYEKYLEEQLNTAKSNIGFYKNRIKHFKKARRKLITVNEEKI